MIRLGRRALFVSFLEDLRKVGFAFRLGDLNCRLFNAKKILATIFYCVWATLKAFNFRDMTILPSSATILIVVNVLVWILWLDHLLLVVIFE